MVSAPEVGASADTTSASLLGRSKNLRAAAGSRAIAVCEPVPLSAHWRAPSSTHPFTSSTPSSTCILAVPVSRATCSAPPTAGQRWRGGGRAAEPRSAIMGVDAHLAIRQLDLGEAHASPAGTRHSSDHLICARVPGSAARRSPDGGCRRLQLPPTLLLLAPQFLLASTIHRGVRMRVRMEREQLRRQVTRCPAAAPPRSRRPCRSTHRGVEAVQLHLAC